MKKFLKSFKQSATYNEGEMESRDHFKNGASPKSLTNRGNLNLVCLKEWTFNIFNMKKIFNLFMIPFVLLAMGACTEDSDNGNAQLSDEDLLVDATFYEGEYPQDGLIRYVDENNDEFSLYGFKGWVDVYFQDNIKLEQASQMIISLNGEIIEKIPAINYYLVKVPEDTEVDFIKRIRDHNVEYAYPRLIYRFSSCEHSTVIIDDFRESKDSHGKDVKRMYNISSNSPKNAGGVYTDPNIIWDFDAGSTDKKNKDFTDITKAFNALCTDNYYTKANLVNISSAPDRRDYKDDGSFYEVYKAYLEEIIVWIKKIKQRRTDGGDMVVTIGAGNNNMLLYGSVINPLKSHLSKDEKDIFEKNILIVGTNTLDKKGKPYSNGSAKDSVFAIVSIEDGWTDDKSNPGDDGTSFAAPRVLGYINRLMNEVQKSDGTCITAVEALSIVKRAVAQNTDGLLIFEEAKKIALSDGGKEPQEEIGFFAGTAFYNTAWNVTIKENYTATGTRRKYSIATDKYYTEPFNEGDYEYEYSMKYSFHDDQIDQSITYNGATETESIYIINNQLYYKEEDGALEPMTSGPDLDPIFISIVNSNEIRWTSASNTTINGMHNTYNMNYTYKITDNKISGNSEGTYISQYVGSNPEYTGTIYYKSVEKVTLSGSKTNFVKSKNSEIPFFTGKSKISGYRGLPVKRTHILMPNNSQEDR